MRGNTKVVQFSVIFFRKSPVNLHDFFTEIHTDRKKQP